MSQQNIVAFISHATADNDRFVLPFNDAIRAGGIETIIDTQDFRPGQSLVTSIFDRGIYSANAIVLILSRATADRAWVRAELEHAVVRNVEEQIPVIAVILDGVDVPPPLRSTIQIRVKQELDPGAVATSVIEALRAPARVFEMPTAYPASRWALIPLHKLTAETSLDEYVELYALEELLGRNVEFVDVAAVLEELRQNGQGDAADLETTLDVLEARGIIHRVNEMGARLPFAFELTEAGTEELLERFAPDPYRAAFDAVVAELRARYPSAVEIDEVANMLSAPSLLILHIGRKLEAMGVARVEQYVGGTGDIIPLPGFRRLRRQ